MELLLLLVLTAVLTLTGVVVWAARRPRPAPPQPSAVPADPLADHEGVTAARTEQAPGGPLLTGGPGTRLAASEW